LLTTRSHIRTTMARETGKHNNNDDGDNKHDDNDKNPSSTSILDRYKKARTLVESSPEECFDQLREIQNDVATLALFSDNETIDDISTQSIQFLALEHLLATALVNIPTGPGMMDKRKANLLQSLALWAEFLQRLEVLEVLSSDETKEFHALLEVQNSIVANDNDDDENEGNRSSSLTSSSMPGPRLIPTSNRDTKIARFKAKQQLQKEIQRLHALRERRSRFDVAVDDEMDGHDSESLDRSLALAEIGIYRGEALENWGQTLQELPMIDRMVQMENERRSVSKYGGGAVSTSSGNDRTHDPRSAELQRRPQAQPLQLTHITQDATTGNLQIRKEEIRSKVFRPGWNQPTMSLEELGEREYRAAIEREERQKIAEAEQQNAPRRYEQLVKDGLEDNPDLVDASAQLDREWDDWKDQNPRGSGNKMANRGDKNF
jgi:immunoglobulin-binding protein 1